MLDKALCFFLGAYIFFLCSTVSNAGYSISCAGLLILLIICSVRMKRRFILPDYYFCSIYGLFFLLLFLSAYCLGNAVSIESTWRYLYYTFPFVILYFSFLYNFSEKTLQVSIFAAAAILSAYSMYQFITLPLGTRIPSVFTSPNKLPMVLEVFFPFMAIFLLKKSAFALNKIGMFCIFCATTAALLLTQSRGGILGVVIGLFVVLLGRIILFHFSHHLAKRLVIYFAAVVCVIGISGTLVHTVFDRNYDSERILLVKSSYAMWNDHPWYGVGFDNWAKEYQTKYILPEARERLLDMPHNTVAFFFSATGTLGGIGYLIFVLGTMGFLTKRMMNDPENLYVQAMLWAFMSMFIHGLVDAGMTNKFAARLLFGFLGITLASLQVKNIIESKQSESNDLES